MSSLFRTWARRIFTLDLRSLALVRVLLGALLVVDSASRFTILDSLYTDAGALPRPLELKIVPEAWWSLLNISGGLPFSTIVLGAAVVASAAFCLGYRTRLLNIVCWVLLVSIQNRNPLVYHSGDNLLRLALYWSLFLPLGARFSLDAARRKATTEVEAPAAVCSVGTFCFVVQILLVFGCLLDHKLMGHAWRSGVAVSEALQVDQYQRHFGARLLGHPALLGPLTYAVLASQALVIVLLLSPARVWPRLVAIAVTIATQIGFGLSFRLGHFPWTTSALMLAFLPAEAWNWAARRWTALRSQLLSAPAGPSRRWRTQAQSVWALVSLFLVLCWNLGEAGATVTLHGKDVAIPDTAVGHLAEALRLDQRWSMFAPNPQTEDGWIVLSAQTDSGETLNVLPWLLGDTRGGTVRAGHRGSIARALGYRKSQRWALALLNIAEDPEPPALEGLASWGCRQWNAAASPAHRIRGIAVIYERFEHLEDGTITSVAPERLWDQPCAPSAPGGSRKIAGS